MRSCHKSVDSCHKNVNYCHENVISCHKNVSSCHKNVSSAHKNINSCHNNAPKYVHGFFSVRRRFAAAVIATVCFEALTRPWLRERDAGCAGLVPTKFFLACFGE